MNENFILYLWTFQLFQTELFTTDGQPIRVESPGWRNADSGPDFFNGRVRIGDTLWAGNIEIHVKSSDWFKHGHQTDEAYNNIVLHVVMENDRPIQRKNGEWIPTLEIKNKFDPQLLERYTDFLSTMHPIPCNNQLQSISHFTRMSWYDALMIERLGEKTTSITNSLSSVKQYFNESFYQKLGRNFGFKTNADAMEQLTVSMPLSVLARHKDNLWQLEALLFGQAGLLSRQFKDDYPTRLLNEYNFLKGKYGLQPMDKKVWKFMRMRPANFPTIRISQLAHLLHKSPELLNTMLDAEKFSHIQSLFNVSASDYWDNHFHFDREALPKRKKKLGATSSNLIIINTIIPFLFVYSQLHERPKLQQKALIWLDQMPGEQNAVTRLFTSCGLDASSALQSQAMLQLKSAYCDKKRCLECRFGHELLKKG